MINTHLSEKFLEKAQLKEMIKIKQVIGFF